MNLDFSSLNDRILEGTMYSENGTAQGRYCGCSMAGTEVLLWIVRSTDRKLVALVAKDTTLVAYS